MTDKVADFFKDVKERFSSPLFSSFIIAWLIINWKVPVALFWYDQKVLKGDGYSSYMDLISKISSRWNFFWWPLLLAFFYTFGYPIFRNIVLAANAWSRRWGTDWVINISRESKVPMRTFLQLREKYYTQTKLLENVIGQENTFQNENAGLRNRISGLEAERNRATLDADNWMLKNQISALNGEWEYTTNHDVKLVSERVRFHNGEIRFYNNISGEGTYREFRSLNFSYNLTLKKVILDIQSPDGKVRWHYDLNDRSNDLSELDGTVYKLVTVAQEGRYNYNSYQIVFRKLGSATIEDVKKKEARDIKSNKIEGRQSNEPNSSD